MNPSPIPVGTATKAGLTGAGGSFALAIVAYATGDRSTVTVTALVGGVVSLLATMAGRYAQAIAAHKPSVHISGPLTPGVVKASPATDAEAPARGDAVLFGDPPASHVEPFEFSDAKLSISFPSVKFAGDPGGTPVNDVDDADLPAAGELPETQAITAATAHKTIAAADRGDAGVARVALARAEGGQA